MESHLQAPALLRLAERLKELTDRGFPTAAYAVPPAWQMSPAVREAVGNGPAGYWRTAVEEILARPATPLSEESPSQWSRNAAVYCMYIRTALGFDHDEDGRILLEHPAGYRETGTLMKAICLLPWIRHLGCNTIHLLPVSVIGESGRKGRLGSPYAVADPHVIDPCLAEPLVGLGAEVELAAFVEAAHHLGLRVIVEFALRTAARDSRWALENPAWFYWKRTVEGEEEQRPAFSKEALAEIRRCVADGVLDRLTPPDAAYREAFVPPPPTAAIRRGDEGWEASDSHGGVVRIPGAFADWPPDDRQPLWSDVTYLRLFDHPEFNYVAYNTIRMYDRRLARVENRVISLWDRLVDVIPTYIRRFDIDGAFIDMGHALPSALRHRLIQRARETKPTFAFWSEEFSPGEQTRRDGYDAAMGNYWWTVHRPTELRRRLAPGDKTMNSPVWWLAAPETHNTPRCAAREGGMARSLFAWTFGCFLPAIPFVHSGFELGETWPLNTGLDFSDTAAAHYPEEGLFLYNEAAYVWGRDPAISERIRRCLALRAQWLASLTEAASWVPVRVSQGRAVAYARRLPEQLLLVVGNPRGLPATAGLDAVQALDGLHAASIGMGSLRISAGHATMDLAPWGCCVFLLPLTQPE